jgi:hypothetical protein
MANIQRTSHNLVLVAAAILSLGAIGTSANAAGVDVQIGFGVPGIVVDARDPYYYSPNYCAGCWYGEWGGRTGYNRGGGRPGESRTNDAVQRGQGQGRDGWT